MNNSSSVGAVNAVRGYTQYAPPPHKPDSDSQRFIAQAQARAQPPVQVTLSPDAQKALAAQQTGQQTGKAAT